MTEEEKKEETPEPEEKSEEKEETSQEEEKKEEGSEEPEAPPTTLDEAKEVLKGMTEQNKIHAANLKKQEKLNAEALLGGKAPAGQGLTKEMKNKQDGYNLIKGTGFEDLAFPELKKAK